MQPFNVITDSGGVAARGRNTGSQPVAGSQQNNAAEFRTFFHFFLPVKFDIPFFCAKVSVKALWEVMGLSHY